MLIIYFFVIIVVIILAIIISSVLFYDYKKIDYEHERESFEIMNKISMMINGTNVLYPESSYFSTSQTIEQWPSRYVGGSFAEYDVIVIPTDNFNSVEDYIMKFKDKGLTHIIVDDKKERQIFLKEIFVNEENFAYLNKIYDSNEDGFNYHVKVFEINYKSLSSVD